MMIVLASKSPRRKEILADLGIDFETVVEEVDESSDVSDPAERAMGIASRKAGAVRDMLVSHNIDVNSLAIVGADTIVYAEGEFLGKPADREDARRMLTLLSGRTHKVITGVAVAVGGRIECDASVSEVDFCEMTEADIEAYLDTDEPYDKAGAYAIQGIGASFVRYIEGDFFSVMGLSPKVVRKLFSALGISYFDLINGVNDEV